MAVADQKLSEKYRKLWRKKAHMLLHTDICQEQIKQFGEQANTIKMIFKHGNDQRQYNEPQHDEVAAIFVGDEGAPPFKRDIIVCPKDAPTQLISYL